jgi:hypothetical protein
VGRLPPEVVGRRQVVERRIGHEFSFRGGQAQVWGLAGGGGGLLGFLASGAWPRYCVTAASQQVADARRGETIDRLDPFGDSD